MDPYAPAGWRILLFTSPESRTPLNDQAQSFTLLFLLFNNGSICKIKHNFNFIAYTGSIIIKF